VLPFPMPIHHLHASLSWHPHPSPTFLPLTIPLLAVPPTALTPKLLSSPLTMTPMPLSTSPSLNTCFWLSIEENQSGTVLMQMQMQTEYSFLLCFPPDPLINTSFEQSYIFSVNILKENKDWQHFKTGENIYDKQRTKREWGLNWKIENHPKWGLNCVTVMVESIFFSKKKLKTETKSKKMTWTAFLLNDNLKKMLQNKQLLCNWRNHTKVKHLLII